MDIATAVTILSGFRIKPRIGHLERVKRVYGYISQFKDAVILSQAFSKVIAPLVARRWSPRTFDRAAARFPALRLWKDLFSTSCTTTALESGTPVLVISAVMLVIPVNSSDPVPTHSCDPVPGPFPQSLLHWSCLRELLIA